MADPISNQLTGEIPTELGNLSNLVVRAKTRHDRGDPTELATCPDLTFLRLDDGPIDEQHQLAELPRDFDRAS